MPLATHTLVDDRYRILRPLGVGGYGAVYEAYHEQLERKVALKFLEAGNALNQETLIRFEREAKALSSIHHRNVVSLYGFGLWQQQPYIAMEYVEGPTMLELVRRQGALPPERAVTLLVQVLDALSSAHAYGVVHRDLKPNNIIVATDADGKDVAKVVDFGLVKLLAESDAQKLTQTASTIGTPLYMSPEQAQGQPVDTRSDIYSAACLLYFALVGKPLFEADEQVAVMAKHIYEAPDLHLPEISTDVRHVLHTALQKDPDQRYQTASEMSSALLKCKTIPDVDSSRTKRPKKPARQHTLEPLHIRILLVCGALGLSVISVMSFFMLQTKRQTEQSQRAHELRVDRDLAEIQRRAYDSVDDYRAGGHEAMSSPRAQALLSDCREFIDAYGKHSKDAPAEITELLSHISQVGEDMIALNLFDYAKSHGYADETVLEDPGLMRVCSAYVGRATKPQDAARYLPYLKPHVDRAFAGDYKQMFISIPIYILALHHADRESDALAMAHQYYDLEKRIHPDTFQSARAALLLYDSEKLNGQKPDPALMSELRRVCKDKLIDSNGDMHSVVTMYLDLVSPTYEIQNKAEIRRQLIDRLSDVNAQLAEQLSHGTWDPFK